MLHRSINILEFFKLVLNLIGAIKLYYRQQFNLSFFFILILDNLIKLRMITDYNRYMGGVDNFDSLISFY